MTSYLCAMNTSFRLSPRLTHELLEVNFTPMGMFYYVVHGMMKPAWPHGTLVWRFYAPQLLPSMYWHVNDQVHLLYYLGFTEWPEAPRARTIPLGRSLLPHAMQQMPQHVQAATFNNPVPALENW